MLAVYNNHPTNSRLGPMAFCAAFRVSVQTGLFMQSRAFVLLSAGALGSDAHGHQDVAIFVFAAGVVFSGFWAHLAGGLAVFEL